MALKAVAAPLGSPVGGTGTTNTIPRWTGASTLGDSVITQDGTSIGVRQATPSAYLAGFNTLVVGDPALANTGITLASGTASDGTFAFADGTVGNAAYRGYIQYKHATDTMQIGTAASPQITILSTGNVGIGTASPAARVNVDGNAVYNNTATQAFRVSNGSTRVVDIGYDSSLEKAFIQPVQLGTAYRDLLLAPNGGNVGVGTASPGSYNASAQQLVVYKAGGTGLTIANDPGNTGAIMFARGTTGADTYRGIFKYEHVNERYVIAVNGADTLRIGTTAIDASLVSGYGLKLPATPGNGDTQTLDAYREDTWTTTFGNYTNCSAASLSNARLTRVGRQVTLEGTVSITVTAGATLTQFAFVLPANRSSTAQGGCGTAQVMGGNYPVGGVTNVNANNNSAFVTLPATGVSAGAVQIDFTYTYFTAT